MTEATEAEAEDDAAANECNARFYPLFAPLSVREVGADTQLSDLSFAPPCIRPTVSSNKNLPYKQDGLISDNHHYAWP